ncbi:MAG: type III-B CRISPR module RAMP protein Cmr6 [Ignavibacteria bacterium]|jgi:CRISPR-associated protein Cmr6
MGHNASHYFYVSPCNGREWTRDIDTQANEFFFGFDPFSDGKGVINGKTYFKHLSFSFAKGFRLTTTYPGLIIGSGYSHPAISEGNDSDYQLGFFFDHTLGVPIIPGSTVKGVLKNVFPKEGAEKRNEKLEYINQLVKNELQVTESLITFKNWNDIFFKKGNVFFHAFPIAIKENNVNGAKKLFADDAIAPHKDLFTEPVPLRFLKIPAGVEFKFQFLVSLYKFENGTVISVENILNIFKQILLDFGICAKRNVGYGHFVQ